MKEEGKIGNNAICQKSMSCYCEIDDLSIRIELAFVFITGHRNL